MIAVERTRRAAPGIQLPSLLVALVIMLGGTAYPWVMANPSGKADHALATLLFWSMSAGFVRGMGFVPHSISLRWLFSGWACLLSFALAVVVKLTH